jgi:hypothetical protein
MYKGGKNFKATVHNTTYHSLTKSWNSFENARTGNFGGG